MSFEKPTRRVQEAPMLRTSGAEIKTTPALVSEESVRSNRRSGENNVLQAELEYKNGKTVQGFVLRQFKDGEIVGPEIVRARIDDTLQQWDRIREVKRDLNQRNKSGLNIPGTVRGVVEGEASGILMSDLTEDGKYEAVDLKMLRAHPEKVSPKQWKKIKQTVLRDLDIATANGIKLVGGNAGLDAWLTIRDPKKNTYKVFLADIGPYTSIEHHPNTDDPKERDLLSLKQKAIDSIERLEKDLEEKWAAARKKRFPWFKKNEGQG